jgi:glyoxylate/hydroxypyruvate reductase
LPWSPTLLCGHSLSSRTIGFIGFGRIAQATLVRLLPYGISKAIYLNSTPGEKIPKEKDYMGILEASEKGEFKAFGKGNSNVQVTPAKSSDELAAESDVVIVCCALTPQTKHMINAEFLGKMKKDAVVVNSARGGIVDSVALARALDEGRIWGAGLDVVEGEPDVAGDHVLVK